MLHRNSKKTGNCFSKAGVFLFFTLILDFKYEKKIPCVLIQVYSDDDHYHVKIYPLMILTNISRMLLG